MSYKKTSGKQKPLSRREQIARAVDEAQSGKKKRKRR